MVHAHGHRHRLQFAGAAGNAVGADVVALGEKQLHRHPPQLLQFRGVGRHHLAVQGFAGAGGLQLALAFDRHQTEAAGPHGRQAIEVAQHWQGQPRHPAGRQQARSSRHGHGLAIDPKGDYGHQGRPPAWDAGGWDPDGLESPGGWPGAGTGFGPPLEADSPG